ncbi:MAG: ABC transporter ATP-binding protein, partial [Erysipelotrichales bacterium]|nr:ABC transporter ATP-binding protein [Erysipelotrichales bacterium]
FLVVLAIISLVIYSLASCETLLYFYKTSSKVVFKHSIIRYLRERDILLLLLVVLFIVLQVWLDLTMPDYTSELTKSVSSNALSMKDIWHNGGMMLLCAFGSMLSAFACTFFCSRIANAFAKTLREALFNKTTSFSSTEMKRFSIPSLITRTTNDVTQVQMFLTMGLQMLIKAPILAIWAIAKISVTSVEWTTATMISVAIIVLSVGIIVSVVLPKFKRIQKLTDNLNDVTRENISGVRVVRAFNAEKYQEEKFENANNALTKNHLFTSKTMGLLMPVMTICMNGLTLAIYWIGAILINDIPLDPTNIMYSIEQRATVLGNMTAFTQYALQVVMAFMMLIMIFIFLPRTIVSSKRINEVLNTENSIIEGTIENDSNLKGEIEFKDVSFIFDDGSSPVLSNISFTAHRGETIAIIGATGSGKTTLIELMPRFHDVTSGEIIIDGMNVKDYTQDELQSKIAIASQKACLFKGDIKDNIIYGCQENVEDDDPRIKKSLEIASANFVFELQDGIHSEVAQGGTNFSGGQKQRLSIARTIFKDAEIMIFDDSFSALDYKTDMLVRKQIKEQLSDKTIIIVAQRIGTIRQADKIIVLDDGKIVGLGKHEELLKNCAVYKDIALSQLAKEEL